ncbi:MAG TPA: BlaI/MecI/CopY family transcriptional regulator [Gemmatimonadaceae bacterium]|nr:BlaI/MecI/CopY family transcriptional regulator [Gemmatimonadaceae bacterium]
MSAHPVPTPAELELLRLLWRHGPQTVRDVHERIKRRRDIGYTTVLKTLQVMAEKGLVTRDESSRSHVYAAAVHETAVKRRLVSDLVESAFDGSAAGLVMQALSTRRASPEEIKEIRRLLDTMKRREEEEERDD